MGLDAVFAHAVFTASVSREPSNNFYCYLCRNTASYPAFVVSLHLPLHSQLVSFLGWFFEPSTWMSIEDSPDHIIFFDLSISPSLRRWWWVSIHVVTSIHPILTTPIIVADVMMMTFSPCQNGKCILNGNDDNIYEQLHIVSSWLVSSSFLKRTRINIR